MNQIVFCGALSLDSVMSCTGGDPPTPAYVADSNSSLQSMYRCRCILPTIIALFDGLVEWTWMRMPTRCGGPDCRKLASRVQFDEGELRDQANDWLALLSDSEPWRRPLDPAQG